MKREIIYGGIFLAAIMLLLGCGGLQKRKVIEKLNQESTARRAAASRKAFLPDRGTTNAPEFRAIWMSRWEYKSPDDITKAIKNLKDYNFNALIFQVRGNGTAYYQSSVEPWAEELGGKNPGWDPLAVALSEGHKAGLQVHAWINTMPGWRGTKPPTSPRQLWNLHKDWFMVPRSRRGKGPALVKGYSFLSPCIPDVRKHIADVVTDLVKRYPVDGIHFDYIRFPGSDYTYDERSIAEFKRKYGKETDAAPEEWANFRRDCVARLLAQCSDALRRTRPGIVISAATWANYPDGFTSYYQDSHGWLAKGLLDVSIPMIYRSSPETFRKFATDHVYNRHQRAVYPGIGSYIIKEPDALLAEVQTCRALGAGGMVFFSYSSLFKEHLPTKLADELLRGPFREPAPPPKLPWITAKDDDIIGPRIKGVHAKPAILLAGKSFRVSCEITDPSGVYDMEGGSYAQGVYLLYGSSQTLSNAKEVTLSKSRGDTYVSDEDIIAPKPDSTIYLRIHAYDNDCDIEEGGKADRAIGASELVCLTVHYPSYGYRFAGEFGEPVCGLQFPDTDAEGRIWVCSWLENQILIYNPDGFFSSISPITKGRNNEGEEIPVVKPSGLAIDKKRRIVYVTSGDNILRFNAKTGKPLPGFKTTGFRCGDATVDDEGYICVTNLIRRRWMKFTPEGRPVFDAELAPFGKNEAGYNNPALTRGIAVTPDGSTVYVVCEDSGTVDIYRRTSESDPGSYRFREGALTSISPRSGAIDIAPDGRIYVSCGDGAVKVFSSDENRIADITGGKPLLSAPRGIAFSPDSCTLYIVQTGSFQRKKSLQKWLSER